MSSKLEAAREKSRLAQEALKAVRDKRNEKDRESYLKYVEDEQKKDAADPRRAEKAYQQWRDSPDGRSISQSKTAPPDGRPDFGGRRRRKTRRGRKTRRYTRRR
jgi:hypothetical protein